MKNGYAQRQDTESDASATDRWQEEMTCGFCRRASTRWALSQYGARCSACYGAWCAEMNPERHVTRSQAESALRALLSGALSGAPPGRVALERLRTFEDRHGRPLNAAQQFQLAALERMYRTPEPADLRREPLDLRREPIDMPNREEAA